MLASCLAVAFLIIWCAPDTFVGMALRRGLVLWPAERLSRLTRGQIVCWLGLGLLVWLAAVVTEGEALILLGAALPDTLAFFTMFEVTTLVDILIAAALISTQAGLKATAQRLRTLLGTLARRIVPRARAPRRHRRTETTKAANDDGDGPAFAYALAA
jgi:hypothetical protein